MIRLGMVAALAAMTAGADSLTGRIAGPPRRCVSVDHLGSPGIERGGLIVYRQVARRWWVSRPVGPCPALRPQATLVVEIDGAQLCRNDRFRVLEPNLHIPSAPCRFDAFVPYDKPASPTR